MSDMIQPLPKNLLDLIDKAREMAITRKQLFEKQRHPWADMDNEEMFDFGQKHLNDLFVLDGIQSVSARDKILREIISNSLAHRDYSSGYVPKFWK